MTAGSQAGFEQAVEDVRGRLLPSAAFVSLRGPWRAFAGLRWPSLAFAALPHPPLPVAARRCPSRCPSLTFADPFAALRSDLRSDLLRPSPRYDEILLAVCRDFRAAPSYTAVTTSVARFNATSFGASHLRQPPVDALTLRGSALYLDNCSSTPGVANWQVVAASLICSPSGGLWPFTGLAPHLLPCPSL